MELKISGIKPLSKSHPWLSPKYSHNSLRAEELAGCARSVARDGVLRMKLVVKKSDLERTLRTLELLRKGSSEEIRERDKDRTKPSSVSAEQRLSFLKRKRSMKGCQWRPELQSIPEEICVF